MKTKGRRWTHHLSLLTAVLVIASLLVMALPPAPAFAAPLDAVPTVTLGNSATGGTSTYTIVWGGTANQAIPINGKIVLTFPANFNVSGVTLTSVAWDSDADGLYEAAWAGSNTIAAAGPVVTITGGNTGNASTLNKPIQVVVGNIVNTATKLGTYTVDVKTTNNADATIDGPTTSGNFKVVDVEAVNITSPLNSSPTYIYAGGARNVVFQVDFDPDLAGAERADVNVSIEVFDGSTIVSTSYTEGSVAQATNKTKSVTTSASAAAGWYNVTVGGKTPSQAAYLTDSETNALNIDNTRPTLTSVVWADEDTSGLINTNDTLTFSFNEAMDHTTLDTAAEKGNLVVLGRTNPFGNIADSDIQWNVARTQMTLTIKANSTIRNNDPVNPADAVTDRAANADNTAAPGVRVSETTRPTLSTITFEDRNNNNQINGGDRLVFTFSEGMDSSKITTANVNTVLPVAGGKTYGTVNAGLDLVWAGDTKSLTVVLGTDHTVSFGDTVNPSDAVTDLAGNIDDTTTPGPNVNASPYLVSAVYTDVDGNGAINANDTVKFTFSEAMDEGTITAADVNTRLAATDTDSYGDGRTVAWSNSSTVLTVTLAGDNISIDIGDTVNPTPDVKDAAGAADATLTAVAISGEPMLNKVTWVDADNDTVVEAGETLIFTFASAMNTTTLDTATEVNTRLPVTDGDQFGNITDSDISWSADGKVLTLTLRGDGGGRLLNVDAGDTINPAGTVLDANGRADITTANGPAIDAHPWLVSAVWTDGGGAADDNAIGAGDTIAFTFNEDMDTDTLNTATEVNARLPISGRTSPYGAIVDGDLAWSGNSNARILTITLKAGATVADGDLVNPTPDVTDAAGNSDQTTGNGKSIEDDQPPLLSSGVWTNIDNSVDAQSGAETVTAGDTVVFTFSEPMNTALLTQANVNSILEVTNNNRPFSYGTYDAGMRASWNAGTVFTVTLGSNAGVVPDTDQVDPTTVKDVAGNARASAAVTVRSAPRLKSVSWTDVDNLGFINAGDQLVFTFSEEMDTSTLDTPAEIQAGLGDIYGNLADNEAWSGTNSKTVLTITLVASGNNHDLTAVQGTVVNPSGAVKDDDGVADATQGTGPAIKNTADPAVPAILAVTATAVNNGNDTIVVTFTENVTGAGTAANWTIETGPDGNNKTALNPATMTLAYVDATDAAAATLTMTLNEPDQYLLNANQVWVTPALNAVKDADNNAVANAAATDNDIADDNTAPAFTGVATAVLAGNDTIVLTFGEYVKPSGTNTWSLGDVNSVFDTIKTGVDTAGLANLNLTGATISPTGASATTMVTITLLELTTDLIEGYVYEVKLKAGAVVDLNTNAVADLDGDTQGGEAIGGDNTAPTFTIAYYSDAALTTDVTNNYLKAGTYYIKITASEKLSAAPSISIAAEGTRNDVTAAATTHVSGNTVYRYQHDILNDPAAVGDAIEVVTINGMDLAGNASGYVNVTGEKFTDTVIATTVTVNSPNGGESLTGGQERAITWTASDTRTPSGSLTISLRYYDGSAWNTISGFDGVNDGVHVWTVPSINTSNALLEVTVSDEAGNTSSDSSNTTFSISAPTTAITQITLVAGWNLISLPRIPVDGSIATIMSGVTGLDRIWRFDPDAGWKSWTADPDLPDQFTTLETGKGYWVKLADGTPNQTVSVSGANWTDNVDPGQTPQTFSVNQGWNLIGYREATALANSSYLTGTSYRFPIYRYSNGVYTALNATSDTMTPGEGYWVYFNADGTISP